MDIPLENLIFKRIDDNTGSTILSLMSFFERIMFLIIAGIMTLFALSAMQTILGFSFIITFMYVLLYILKKKV